MGGCLGKKVSLRTTSLRDVVKKDNLTGQGLESYMKSSLVFEIFHQNGGLFMDFLCSSKNWPLIQKKDGLGFISFEKAFSRTFSRIGQ
jgi:hypothetical protein